MATLTPQELPTLRIALAPEYRSTEQDHQLMETTNPSKAHRRHDSQINPP